MEHASTATRQSSLDALDGVEAELHGPSGGRVGRDPSLDRVGSEGEILLLDCDPLQAPISPVQVSRIPIGEMVPPKASRAPPAKASWFLRLFCCSSNLPPLDEQGVPRAGSISEGWSGAATTEASINAITRTRMDAPALSGTSLPVSPVKRGSRGGGVPKHSDPPALPGGATAARLGSGSLAASMGSHGSTGSSAFSAEEDKYAHAPVLTPAQRAEQRRVQRQLDAIQAQTL